MSLTLKSYAKINLFLQVLGKMENAFHTVRSLMLPISLADSLIFEPLNTPTIEIESSNPSLPTDQSNLIRRAAELLQSRHAPKCGARIRLQKQIPIGAGLGGGSSNGSHTLVGLNRLWNLNLSEKTLEELAAEFGSDTAFFIRCQPALSEGRGEILTPVTFPISLPIFLLNFGFGSSTAWAYKNLELRMKNEEFRNTEKILQELAEYLKLNSQFSILNSQFALQNDLEIPVFKKFPILQIAKDFLKSQPQVQRAMMCGSGSTMMAILESEAEGEKLRQETLNRFGTSTWTWIGHTLPSKRFEQT